MTPADTIFTDGPVFRAGSRARAVAVTGGRISAVGDIATVEALAGPRTRRIDLDGRMLIAAFGDAHSHPLHGGRALLQCPLHDLDDVDAAKERIRAYAAEHPELSWVIGAGWKYDWFERGCPSADELDALVPDRPAYFSVADGHSGWANHRALAAAGIDADTPDPADGRIERLADGTPQGSLHEGAMDLVEDAAPPETDDDRRRGLLAGIEHLLSLGVVHWQDAIVLPELHVLYRDLAAADELRTPVRGALWWARDRGMDQIDDFVDQRAESVGNYVAGSVKLMLDGVCENFTASLLEPWLDADGNPLDHHGIDMIDPRELSGIVTRLDALGFQCHFHAIGDAAVRHALDAVEAARAANGWQDLRHTIAHIQVVHPGDIPRFRRLGVVANMQPLWAQAEPAMTDLTMPFLGPQRAGWQYPFASLRRDGAALAMGSDWPVSTADVFDQVHVAVTRTGHAEATEPFLPHERLDLTTVLEAVTVGSAHVNHLDQSGQGRIASGSVANLAVLDRDPFEERAVAGTRVDMTMIDGDIAFERRR